MTSDPKRRWTWWRSNRRPPRRNRDALKYASKLVDLVGIEPTTSSMPWKRAPSCATGPFERGMLINSYARAVVSQTSLCQKEQSNDFFRLMHRLAAFCESCENGYADSEKTKYESIPPRLSAF